ncbi:uncharacterized protein LOC124886606 [Capsicum annuum]|uniref:uncharacterized protein LOC124886606 n=1 Tax=Capsicum annuum TaxID=4072 RepID=UPI001FB18006|nr:uncharacterized protein LOC124886606 [Capsicum annuum]
MSIESIDRNNELQVIEQILEAEITKPSKIKRVRQKKRILDVETTLLRHNASLNEVNVKSIFIDKQNMMASMSNIAITHNIQFKVIKSSTTRYSVRCLDNNCVWWFHASKIADSLLFRVTTYEKAHSCLTDFITSDHRNATSKVICDYIVELVCDSNNVITPNFMVNKMRRKYRIIISYNKVWRAIQHAYTVIRKTAEDNYNRFLSYLHMMKENNPGTYTNIKRNDESRFQYAFFAYSASIIGWTNCRPVIMADVIFFKAKYHGVLMIAVSKDGNNNLFSLAFRIANSENNESYNWLFN